MQTIRRSALLGVSVGALIALVCGIWFASVNGEQQEAAFLTAAALSWPLSQIMAVTWPESGGAPYDMWFVALIPVINATLLGVLLGALVALMRSTSGE
jgi:hypothetical protein